MGIRTLAPAHHSPRHCNHSPRHCKKPRPPSTKYLSWIQLDPAHQSTTLTPRPPQLDSKEKMSEERGVT